VIDDAYVYTKADFPEIVPDHPWPPGKSAPEINPAGEVGRPISQSKVQQLEYQADILLLKQSGARIEDVRINRTQTNSAGGRVSQYGRPDVQHTIIVEATLPNGRRVILEYDRSPPTRALDHARDRLMNDPDAIVILKMSDFE
jgi:hypothetical protein